MDPTKLKMDRRVFIAGSVAATLTATALGQERDYGPSASPQRYPDVDIKVLDKRFNKYKIGNTPVLRLFTGMLWAEGPAWNAAGRYLVWSDIPNDIQHRWIAEDGHVSTFRNPANNTNGPTTSPSGLRWP